MIDLPLVFDRNFLSKDSISMEFNEKPDSMKTVMIGFAFAIRVLIA